MCVCVWGWGAGRDVGIPLVCGGGVGVLVGI